MGNYSSFTSGTLIDEVSYDSFGKVLSESSPTNGDRFKFTGREYDSTTKQYNYRARYYDAAIGRFTSEDPTGFSSGDTNTYRYVGNSPTFMVDPTGQAAIPAFDLANGPYMENPVYREWLANQSQSTGGRGWLDQFGGWANSLPVFGDVTTGIGDGIHSGLNGIGVPDASLANASDTTLTIGAVGTSIAGGILIVAGGEIILGVGTLGGGGGVWGALGSVEIVIPSFPTLSGAVAGGGTASAGTAMVLIGTGITGQHIAVGVVGSTIAYMAGQATQAEIEWLEEEIARNQEKLDLMDSAKNGYGPNDTTGTLEYLQQLWKRWADLLAMRARG